MPISFTDAFSVDRPSFEEFFTSVMHVLRLKLVGCTAAVFAPGLRVAHLLAYRLIGEGER